MAKKSERLPIATEIQQSDRLPIFQAISKTIYLLLITYYLPKLA
jgi:hypothetical protein